MDRKEALEVIKNHNSFPILREALEALIPELENEDERIRKTIIRLFTEDPGQQYGGFAKEKIVAWLEKQGEQKPAWSEEDEYQINTILHGLNLKKEIYKKEGNKVEEERYNTQYNWLKSFKSKNQWKPSEEQMNALNMAYKDRTVQTETLKSLYNDLKKL